MSETDTPQPLALSGSSRLRGFFKLSAGLLLQSKSPHGILDDILSERIKGKDTLTINFLNKRYVVITHPDDIMSALRPREKATLKSPAVQRSLQINGAPNVFTATGSEWAQKRRAIDAHITPENGIPDKAAEMKQIIASHIKDWDSQTTINPYDEMATLTLKIFSHTLMSYPLSTEEAILLKKHSSEGLQKKFFFGILLRNVFSSTLKDSRFTGANPETQSIFDNFLKKVIAFKQQHPESQTGDYFDQALKSSGYKDEPSTKNFKKFSSDMTIMLFAGHETLSNTLFWSLHILSKHPEIQIDLADEHDISGLPDTAGKPTQSMLSKRIVLETMRLYPSVYMLQRDANTDIALRQTNVRSGDKMIVPIWLVHRNPDLHENPDQFNPNRFLPEQMACIPKGAFLPFGAGPNMCPGKGLALQEACMILTAITGRYRLSLPMSGMPQPRGLLTMLPPPDALLNIQPRFANRFPSMLPLQPQI